MDNEKQAFSYSINLFIQNKLAAASGFPGSGGSSGSQQKGCLLYTSDAADDWLVV